MSKTCCFPGIVGRVLARAQGRLCASCGGVVRPRRESVDHVVPAALGGPGKLGNLVVMHGGCNRLKANRLPNGCELIWLLAVNARLGVGPTVMGTA